MQESEFNCRVGFDIGKKYVRFKLNTMNREIVSIFWRWLCGGAELAFFIIAKKVIATERSSAKREATYAE